MNTTQNRIRVCGLDILKAVCAFCVIMIHAPFPGIIGSYLVALSRAAVPIFFMITGYFYIDAHHQNAKLRQIRKIFFLCLFSNILYFLWGMFLGLMNGEAKLYLSNTINLKSLLQFLLLNESPFGGHLWYLSAILYVLIIVYFLDRWFPKYFGKILLFVTPFLLLGDLAFGKYSVLLLNSKFPYIFVRNFLFVGIPYFTIGFYLRKHSEGVAKLCKKRILLVLLIVFFVLTTFLEKYLLEHYGIGGPREHYISTTFLSIFVFSAFTDQYWNGKMRILYSIGRNYSTYIYIVHPIVITVLKVITRRLSIFEIYTYCRPIAVWFVSLLICILFIKVQTVLRSKFKSRVGSVLTSLKK